MLTGELVRPRLRQRGSTLTVEFVDTQSTHWQRTAAELIHLFAGQLNQPHSIWDTVLEQYEGERIDYVVIRGLAKVLEDAATFRPIDTAFPPVQMREHLLTYGPVFPTADLFNPQSRTDILSRLASELKMSVSDLEQAMFADRSSEYLLREVGLPWTAEGLLARYNMELARGVLYWASEMQVELHDNYKDFWRYLKLFKLMFEAAPVLKGGYQVHMDGPISPFVKSTTRYGRQFAAFLPALFLGKEWQMTAKVRRAPNEDALVYTLDQTSPLHSHFKQSGLFDSKLEEDFAQQFEEKFGEKRGQWLLRREDEVILMGDTVFIPDFSIIHKKDGRRALIEIIGFWHPDYLRRKVDKVRRAGLANLILLVYAGLNLTPDKLADVPSQVLYFPHKPVLKEVMAAVEACAL